MYHSHSKMIGSLKRSRMSSPANNHHPDKRHRRMPQTNVFKGDDVFMGNESSTCSPMKIDEPGTYGYNDNQHAAHPTLSMPSGYDGQDRSNFFSAHEADLVAAAAQTAAQTQQSIEDKWRASCIAALPQTPHNMQVGLNLQGSKSGSREFTTTIRSRTDTSGFLTDNQQTTPTKTAGRNYGRMEVGVVQHFLDEPSAAPTVSRPIFPSSTRAAPKSLERKLEDHERRQMGHGQPLTAQDVAGHSSQGQSDHFMDLHIMPQVDFQEPRAQRAMTLSDMKAAKSRDYQAKRAQSQVAATEYEKQQQALQRQKAIEQKAQFENASGIERLFLDDPVQKKLDDARDTRDKQKSQDQSNKNWKSIQKAMREDDKTSEERKRREEAEVNRKLKRDQLQSNSPQSSISRELEKREQAAAKLEHSRAKSAQEEARKHEKDMQIAEEQRMQQECKKAEHQLRHDNLEKTSIRASKLQGFKKIEDANGSTVVALQPPAEPINDNDRITLQSEGLLHDNTSERTLQPYICHEPNCSKAFKYKNAYTLKQHIKEKHGVNGAESHTCPVPQCPATYTRDKTLRDHIASQHVTMCEISGCYAVLSTEDGLATHRVVEHQLKNRREKAIVTIDISDTEPTAADQAGNDPEAVTSLVRYKPAPYQRRGNQKKIARQRLGWQTGESGNSDEIASRSDKAKMERYEMTTQAALKAKDKAHEKIMKAMCRQNMATRKAALGAMKTVCTTVARNTAKFIKICKSGNIGNAESVGILASLEMPRGEEVFSIEEAKQQRVIEQEQAAANAKRESEKLKRARRKYTAEAKRWHPTLTPEELAEVVEGRMAESCGTQINAYAPDGVASNAQQSVPAEDDSTVMANAKAQASHDRIQEALATLRNNAKSQRTDASQLETNEDSNDDSDDEMDNESIVSEEDPEDFSIAAQIPLPDSIMEDVESDEECTRPEEPPHHLTLNVYSIMRQETINGRTQEPVLLKKFADEDVANGLSKDVANDLAKDLTSRYFWGDAKLVIKKTDSYNAAGLFQSVVTYAEENGTKGRLEHTHRVWVTKHREFTGDLENGRELEYRTKVPVETFMLTTELLGADEQVVMDPPRLFTALDLANQAAFERIHALMKPTDHGQAMLDFEEKMAELRQIVAEKNKESTCFDSEDVGGEGFRVQVKRMMTEGPVN